MSENKTILAIDDHDDYLALLTRMLSKEDFNVLHASSPIKALKWLNDGLRPHLILLDYLMPEMNGLDFLKSIETAPHFSEFKIVILTAHNNQKIIEECFAHGADHYILKRLGRYDVIKKIQHIMLRPRTEKSHICQLEVTNVIRHFEVIEVSQKFLTLACQEEVPSHSMIKIYDEDLQKRFKLDGPLILRVENCHINEERIIIKAQRSSA